MTIVFINLPINRSINNQPVLLANDSGRKCIFDFSKKQKTDVLTSAIYLILQHLDFKHLQQTLTAEILHLKPLLAEFGEHSYQVLLLKKDN